MTGVGGDERRVPPAGTWDRLARVYDRQVRLERSALRAALDLASVGPQDRLLDLGTGTGALLNELAHRGTRPREVVGFDASGEMLAQVSGLPRDWRLVKGDARSLPFEPARFDVVTSSYLLHIVDGPSRAEILHQAKRVLRPGGRLVTVTISRAHSSFGRLLMALSMLAARALPKVLVGLEPLDPRSELVAAGYDVLEAKYVPRWYPSLCVLARAVN